MRFLDPDVEPGHLALKQSRVKVPNKSDVGVSSELKVNGIARLWAYAKLKSKNYANRGVCRRLPRKGCVLYRSRRPENGKWVLLFCNINRPV